MDYIWIIFNGILMGIANVIPGLSGGTLLLITGVYTRFIHVFGSIRLKSIRDYKWRENLTFICLIALGALAAIFATSRLMSWLLDYHSVPVYLLLIGLICGSLDIIALKIDFKRKASYYSLLAGITALIVIVVLSKTVHGASMDSDSINPLLLIVAGTIASTTMVLPGVSGSMILLLIGLYKPVIDSVSRLNVLNIFCIGIGALLGIVLASRFIKRLLEKHSSSTYAFLLGLVISSMVDIFPLSVFGDWNNFIIGIIALIFGIIMGRGLKRLEKKYS